MSARHPSLLGGESPAEWVFVVDPPGSIGSVIGAWTNLRPEGTAAIPLSLRLSEVFLWVMGGFVLGLVSAFAVGGWMEHQHQRFEAEWFLAALAIGAGLGAAIGFVRASRTAPVLTLFVGERGCVQISGRGADAKHEPLLYADVASMRTQIDTMNFRGIVTRTRLVYVTDAKTKKERLWYLSKVAEEAGEDDPQFHFAEQVLAAHARSRA